MTRTSKSVLLTALLVVSAMTAGVSVAEMSSVENTQVQADGVADAAVDSGDVFWQGQFLRFDAGESNTSEVWSLRRVENGQAGSLVTQFLLDGSGSAVFATAGLDGEFVVVDENEQPVVFQNGTAQTVGSVSDASFEIAEQSLNVTFIDSIVENAAGAAGRTDLQVQSNRAGYNFVVFSDQLSASQIADVFPAVEVRDGQAVSTRPASANAIFDANFTGVEPGTYNFTVVTADGTAEDTVSISVSEPVAGTAALSNRTVEEQRGDRVEFNVTFDGTDRATVAIGSQQVGFRALFTVTDANGDGVATVRFDTFRAGVSPGTPGISAAGEDEVTDYRLETEPIPDRLDAATYPVEVLVGSTRTDVGSILLSERSTGTIQTWTAPDAANVRSVSDIAEVATQDDDIAFQDWAVVQVQASGLYSYLQNVDDLNNNSTGLSTTMTRVGEINVPSREVSLDRARLLVDEANDQFFLVFDSNTLEQNSTYRLNFTISSANPYVEEGNDTSLVANFTTVPPTASFDQTPVEVPASGDATVSGTSNLAPGTELGVELANTGQNPFLRRQTATVGEDGTWEATFDLSDVPPNTSFTASITEPSVRAEGVVAGDDGAGNGDGAGAAGETTTEAPNETTTTAEETTTEADDEVTETTTEAGAADETTAEADDEATETTTEAGTETPAEGDETPTAEETTTVAEAATAPAPGFGPVAVGVGLVVLLAVGAFVARRR